MPVFKMLGLAPYDNRSDRYWRFRQLRAGENPDSDLPRPDALRRNGESRSRVKSTRRKRRWTQTRRCRGTAFSDACGCTIGAPHVARAVGNAVFQISARCAAEEEFVCPRPAVRPPAGIVGQFEDRHASGSRRRRRLASFVLSAAATPRQRCFGAAMSSGLCFGRGSCRGLVCAQPKPKDFSQHRGPRYPVKPGGDRGGRFALRPKLFQ